MSHEGRPDGLAAATIRIPPQLADAVNGDDFQERLEWLAAPPDVVAQPKSRRFGRRSRCGTNSAISRPHQVVTESQSKAATEPAWPV